MGSLMRIDSGLSPGPGGLDSGSQSAGGRRQFCRMLLGLGKGCGGLPSKGLQTPSLRAHRAQVGIRPPGVVQVSLWVESSSQKQPWGLQEAETPLPPGFPPWSRSQIDLHLDCGSLKEFSSNV